VRGITGSSRGIGLEFAKLLAAEGVSIAMSACDGERVDKVAEEVRAIGARVIAAAGDIRSPSAQADLVARTTEEFGTIDLQQRWYLYRLRCSSTHFGASISSTPSISGGFDIGEIMAIWPS
jgi:hypothetical protein